MTEPRNDEAMLVELLDRLFPLDRDDEPNEADLAHGVQWWARTCIWWAKVCRQAWAERDEARAVAERLRHRIEGEIEAARQAERFGDEARAELAAAREALQRVEAVRCWTNEDGKRFIFVDDLAAALGGPLKDQPAAKDEQR